MEQTNPTTDSTSTGTDSPAEQIPAPRSICAECGAPYDRLRNGSLCPACQPEQERDKAHRRGKTAERGYGSRWQRLSNRARAAQPFCTDCGTGSDLTVDHTPEAWARYDRGLSLRLEDIDVVCQPCNNDRGPARGINARPGATRYASRLEALIREVGE